MQDWGVMRWQTGWPATEIYAISVRVDIDMKSAVVEQGI